MPVVNIAGLGRVNFPDSMTRDQIQAKARELAASKGLGKAKAAPATKAALVEDPEKDTGDFIPPPREFGRRMVRQLVSPVAPVAEAGRRVANAIDVTDRPSSDSSLADTIRQAAAGIKADPVKGVIKTAAGLTGVPSILEAIRATVGLAKDADLSDAAKTARARGMVAGTIEGLSRLSPLEALMLKSGKKGEEAPVRKVRPDDPGFFEGKRKGSQVPPPNTPKMSPEELQAAVNEAAKNLRPAVDNPADLSPRLVKEPERPLRPGPATAAPPRETVATQRVVRQAVEEPIDRQAAARRRQLEKSAIGSRVVPKTQISAEDLVRSALDETRAAEPFDTNTLPPSEPPPQSRTQMRKELPPRNKIANSPLGPTMEEPGGSPGLAEYSEASARRATEKLRQINAERDSALDEAAGKRVADLRKSLGVEEPPKPTPDTVIPGSTSGKAYAKGATPAEAGARAAAERTAKTATAKGADVPPPGEFYPNTGGGPPGPGERPPLPKLPRKSRAADATLTQAERNAAAKEEAAKAGPAFTDPTARAAGKDLELKVRNGDVHGKDTVARSQAVADSIGAEIAPKATPAPVPPEATGKAVTAVLANTMPHAKLAALLEQVRGSLGRGVELAPELTGEATKESGPVHPAVQAFVDTLDEFVNSSKAKAAEGADLEVSPRQAGIRDASRSGISGVGTRPVPTGSIRVPRGMEIPSQVRMKRDPIIRKAADARAKSLKPFKQKAPVADIQRVSSLADIQSVSPTPVSGIRSKTFREEAAINKMRDIGPPPTGVEPQLWAAINALESEGRAQLERGITDTRIVQELAHFWGHSDLVASRLGLEGKAAKELVRQIAGPPRKPLVQVLADTDSRFKHLIDDPNGFMRTEALIAGTGAAAGGLLGATVEGENVEDRFAYALSGALLGGAIAIGGVRGAGKLARAVRDPQMRANAMHTVETVDSANLLAGPAVIKTSFGSLGGVAAGLWQRLREGDTKAARAGMQFIMDPKNGMSRVFWDTLKKPVQGAVGPYTQAVASKLGYARPKDNLLTRGARQVLRPFVAGDAAGSAALHKMGFSKEESGRLQLVGEPTSWQGQQVLRVINSNFFLRNLMKFPRVRIGGAERGIEFMPGMQRFNTRNAPRAEQLTRTARRARMEFGGVALLTGTAYGYLRDPSLQESGVASAAAGPAFLPAAMGIAAGKGLRAGKEPLTEMLLTAASQTPQIGEADVRPSGLVRRFTPLSALRRAIEQFGQR